MKLSDLFEPFSPDRISWRVGSTNKDKTKGMALAYIDARDVMDRLDSVCGVGGWQNTYPHANGKTVCAIGIKIDGEWVWKSNGAGDTDVEAEKGALSDAFKRSAVLWGVGRYLYDLPSPWIEIEPFGRSYKIKDSERGKLERILPKAAIGSTQSTISDEYKMAVAAMQKLETRGELKAWYAGQKEALQAMFTDHEREMFVIAYKERGQSLPSEAS
jgi:hypothetical protein